ncbi:tetratricopeptide repeat 16, DNA J protein C31 [Hibiscus trionum]|uniref:Tetratricopeptide repeat 16, DNA J protein C31 n=1 Tax=Hibiscus trionum TaxID=183268 RepID=A0A9W7HPA8_HIBTR|nr:tetratricopeptide repeat 16, DNA J protein C31 [Hibiscus trionum]
MNSSSSFGFGGDFSSGFPKSTPNNTNFSFNAPSAQRPSGGLPRPKPAKSKKQLNSHNSKSSGKAENRTGSGFNLPRHPSLSDGSDLGGNLFSKLPNDITKLNIDNYCSEGDCSNNDDDNVGSFIGRGVETGKLSFESRSKSNVTGNDVDGAKRDFVFMAGKSNLFRSVSDTLCDGVKNLNIKGFGNSYTKESCESSGHLGGKRDDVLSAGREMKLNIGSVMGDSTGQTDRGFTFQAATTKAHMDYPKTDIRPGGAAASTLFSSSSLPFQASSNPFGTTSDRPGKTDEFCFTAKQDAIETPFVEFKTPNSQTNKAFGLNKKLEFGAKKESGTSTKGKKKKGKSKQPKPVQLWHEPDFVSSKTSARCSREPSVTSNDSFSLDNKDDFSDTQSGVSYNALYGELVATAQYMNIKEDTVKDELKEEGSGNVFDGISAEAPQEDSVHESKTENFASAAEDIDALSSAETEASSRTSIDRQDSDAQMYFSSLSNSEHITGFDFTFAASPSGKGQQSSQSRHHKKKNSAKSASLHLSTKQYLKAADVSTMQSKVGGNSGVDKGPEAKCEPNLSSSSTAAVESCEKWRLRGNQAYANGDSSKAEEYYMQGISCIPAGEKSRSCLRALMLCYSNLAATRMSLGRMRDALGDCMMAISIDPNFLRVQLRAANCYLALGEVENAMRYFRKCLQSGTDVCVDRKVAVDASDGLQKAQKLSECMHQSALLLQSKTSDDAETALEVIAEALQISVYSDQLLEMKAEALLILGKYEDVIQLCDQTFDSAEKNSPSLDVSGQLANPDGSGFSKDPTFRIWRCHLIFKSYFHIGKLEEAIAFLEKQEELQSTTNRDVSNSLESSIPLAATVRELLSHKAAGNEAFQSGRHLEAVEHYTAALSCNVESRPFAAVCFCNRAAAYKAVGQITEAIADCSLAIALDSNYLKAISRRATLYEKIRDYGKATDDLERLLSLLMKQMETKSNQTGLSDRSVNLENDTRHARSWLSEIEEEGKKEVPLDFYLILGLEPSVSTADIKKAYRKAALRHHPDKAVQSLVRTENGDDKLWKEIREEAYKDADKLFKIIGEAYAVLSDPMKRSRYDSEEETRNLQKKHIARTSRAAADGYNDSFDKRSGMRSGREARRAFGSSISKGSKATRSNRFF